MPDPSIPIPAATVVVVRDRPDAPPDLLMVERSAAMVFAGGAMAFPGGRVDAGDVAFAAACGQADGDDATGRIAAVREAIEEVGVAPGVFPSPDQRRIREMRDALHGGMAIGPVLGDASIDLTALVPFARWLPRDVPHRIFDTRFYLAHWQDDAPAPVVDATENSRLVWTTAAQALADADAKRTRIIFPTRRNLERLARYAGFAEAAADAHALGVRTVTPWVEARDGSDWLCIPEDLGYPVTAERLTSALRA